MNEQVQKQIFLGVGFKLNLAFELGHLTFLNMG